MSVVSFDDNPLADWLRPGLSTFAIPHYDLGRRSVELLLEAIETNENGPSTHAVVHRLPMPLRSRGSVAPPRA